jgi:hypothetical protein
MRVTSGVLHGQYVGQSQSTPGEDATMWIEGRDYRYHYHANRYADPDLTSITLTIFSVQSGRRQHVTANENRGGWAYDRHGDAIMSWRHAEDKLADKIAALRSAQAHVDRLPPVDPLSMSLGSLIARNEGRRY